MAWARLNCSAVACVAEDEAGVTAGTECKKKKKSFIFFLKTSGQLSKNKNVFK